METNVFSNKLKAFGILYVVSIFGRILAMVFLHTSVFAVINSPGDWLYSFLISILNPDVTFQLYSGLFVVWPSAILASIFPLLIALFLFKKLSISVKSFIIILITDLVLLSISILTIFAQNLSNFWIESTPLFFILLDLLLIFYFKQENVRNYFNKN